MSRATTQALAYDITSIAAGTAEDRYYSPPHAGTWRIKSAQHVPATTDAADASNYTTLALKKSSNSLGTLTNATVALTAGTPRAWTIDEAYNSFIYGTDVLNLNKAETGSGGILDGVVTIEWEKLR